MSCAATFWIQYFRKSVPLFWEKKKYFFELLSFFSFHFFLFSFASCSNRCTRQVRNIKSLHHNYYYDCRSAFYHKGPRMQPCSAPMSHVAAAFGQIWRWYIIFYLKITWKLVCIGNFSLSEKKILCLYLGSHVFMFSCEANGSLAGTVRLFCCCHCYRKRKLKKKTTRQ